MRWVTYRSPSDRGDHAGLPVGDTVRGVAETLRDPDRGAGPGRGGGLFAPLPDRPSIRDVTSTEEHVVTSTEALSGTVDPVWGRPARWADGARAVRSPAGRLRVHGGGLPATLLCPAQAAPGPETVLLLVRLVAPLSDPRLRAPGGQQRSDRDQDEQDRDDDDHSGPL